MGNEGMGLKPMEEWEMETCISSHGEEGRDRKGQDAFSLGCRRFLPVFNHSVIRYCD